MEDRDFEVGSVTTVATENKVDAEFMEEWLNQNFRLRKYGFGVEQLFLMYTVTEEPREGYYQFHPDDQLLELTLPLPESELKKAGTEAILRLMTEAMLHQLAGIPDRVIEGFDLPAFLADLRSA